jgi:hypothetical protein
MRPLFRSALVLLIIVTLTGCNFFTSSWTSIGEVEYTDGKKWFFSAGSASGEKTTMLDLTESELSAVFVAATLGEGEATLTFSQVGEARSVDLTEGYEGPVDLSGLEPGPVKVTIACESAKNLNVVIRWESPVFARTF